MSASDHLNKDQHRARPRIADLVGWHMPEHADDMNKDGSPLATSVSKGRTPKDRKIISSALKTEYGYRKRDALLEKVEDPEMREYMRDNDISHEKHVDEDEFMVWQSQKDNKNKSSDSDDHWEPDEREDRHLNSMWEN